MEKQQIDPKMLLYHMYRYDIAGEILTREILNKHGPLVGWYREYRKESACMDGDEKSYEEVNWFLTKNVLARMEICPDTIDIRIWNRSDITVIGKLFKITASSVIGTVLSKTDIIAYSEITNLPAPQDGSYYKQYYDVIGLLESTN